MMRTAIYARVSTTNHGQDVSLQTGELRHFAEASRVFSCHLLATAAKDKH